MSSSTDPERKTDNSGVEASNIVPVTALPKWLPDAVRLYLDHTEDGQSLRSLARRDGLHASTVLRHVRRCEMRRDDPLVDEALSCLQQSLQPEKEDIMQISEMTAPKNPPKTTLPNDALIAAESLRVLRRLAETGAFLAIAPDMDKAAVMRAFPDGRVMRMAVVERSTAQAFALKDWISIKKSGRVTTYEITASGRAEVKARLGDRGMAEGRVPFEDWEGAKRVRYNLSESPVAVLGRRRDKDGKTYLEPDLIHAAERLREDFELSQLAVAPDWEKVISEGKGTLGGNTATARVAAALLDLGPGLGDVALQVCCHLEGVEVTEQRLGWAARSGKVVLRIALQRLWRHYQETYGRSGPMIG